MCDGTIDRAWGGTMIHSTGMCWKDRQGHGVGLLGSSESLRESVEGGLVGFWFRVVGNGQRQQHWFLLVSLRVSGAYNEKESGGDDNADVKR